MRAWLEQRRLDRFHRKCDRLGVPADVRSAYLRMCRSSGKKPSAPTWYAGRTAELKGGSSGE